jgi:hypothetical protein
LVQAKLDRVRRFVKRFHLELKRALIGMAPSTFSAAVEIASRIEGKDLEQVKQKGKEGFRLATHKRPGQFKWPPRDKYPK